MDNIPSTFTFTVTVDRRMPDLIADDEARRMRLLESLAAIASLTPAGATYRQDREMGAPPTAQPKRYQRRKIGHTRPIPSRLAWRRALCA